MSHLFTDTDLENKQQGLKSLEKFKGRQCDVSFPSANMSCSHSNQFIFDSLIYSSKSSDIHQSAGGQTVSTWRRCSSVACLRKL